MGYTKLQVVSVPRTSTHGLDNAIIETARMRKEYAYEINCNTIKEGSEDQLVFLLITGTTPKKGQVNKREEQ